MELRLLYRIPHMLLRALSFGMSQTENVVRVVAAYKTGNVWARLSILFARKIPGLLRYG
jgi:hypothetical protein